LGPRLRPPPHPVTPSPAHPVIKGLAVRKAAFSYFRRWTYETNAPDSAGKRINRLVAEAGTELELTFNQPPTDKQLAELTWGLGEWAECGFGAVDVGVVE